MKMAGDENLSRPYAQHPWVYACVSSIAKAVASVPLVLQTKGRDGEMAPVDSGPLYDLLRKPNKLMSQRKFLKSITQTQQLYGETMLLMMSRNSNGMITYIDPTEKIQVPQELWPVRGDLLEEIIDERTNLPRAWRMQTAKGTVEIPNESLIHIAEANPYNPIRGMGPMAAAFRTCAKDFVLDRYDEALLQNSGSPGGILSVDGHLTDADQRAISDAWRESHGRPESNRKTAVLPQGTKYEEVGFSPQEMEFQQMRLLNRETVMSIFGVTKPIIGLTEGLNYASSLLAFRSFYEVTVIPFLDFLADEMETKFISRLVGPESEYSLGFDLSGVAALREDTDAKVDRALKLFGAGGRTFSEAANLAGWDIGDTEIERGDIAFIPTNVTELQVDEDGNMIKAPSPIPAPPSGSEEDEDEDDEGEEDEIAIDEDDDEQEDRNITIRREVSFPAGLETVEAREKYWREWDAEIQRGEDRIGRGAKRVLREIVLQMRKRLREVAEGPWQEYPEPTGRSICKTVATEAEIQRLLNLNVKEWGDEMIAVLDPRITALIIDSAIQAHMEIGGSGMILSATDPVVVRYLAEKKIILANISKDIIRDVQRSIVKIIAAGDGSYNSLREAIWFTLKDSEAYLGATMKGLGTRASRIARTETTGAANYGRQQQMVSDGINTNIWLAMPTARPTHAELNGTEVPVGDYFGYGLKFPGDPEGGPAEVINCRCVLLPGKQRES